MHCPLGPCRGAVKAIADQFGWHERWACMVKQHADESWLNRVDTADFYGPSALEMGGEASVDNDCLAGEVGGGVAGQVHGGAGDFLGAAPPAQ